MKYSNAVALRDSIRNEVIKQKLIQDELNDTNEQHKMNIMNNNNVINYNEAESIRLRKAYEESVRDRNERGLQLISRSEEVMVIYEKSNGQESVLTNGNIELQAREEEIKFLRLTLDEEKRQLALCHKQVTTEHALSSELDSLRQQLLECQNLVIQLERKVEDCNDPTRMRFLDGEAESPDEIVAKVEKLEAKLARVEEQCLEKELIIEQVNRLTERISGKVSLSKDDTLELAKQVNHIQHQIKDATKKMMANVSELSIAQAGALKLQEELKTKEMLAQQYNERMAKVRSFVSSSSCSSSFLYFVRFVQGEAPSNEIEHEWLKYVENMERARSKVDNELVSSRVFVLLLLFLFVLNQFARLKKKTKAGGEGCVRAAQRLRDDSRAATQRLHTVHRERLAVAQTLRTARSLQATRARLDHATHQEAQSETD